MGKLIANDHAYQTLAAYLRGGRLSHALLIEGPAGCGKRTFAGEVAQAVLCSAQAEERPCGQCRDCVKVDKGIHPDLLTYGGEGGSRSFHIDTVRALRQEAYVMPNEADRKVLLLLNVQEMSVQAQNALLKIIEEPPRHVTFLLTCDNRAALLETIRSRVQALSLSLPTVEQCGEILGTMLPEEARERLANAARQAGGSVGKALTLLEQEEDPAGEILYNACIGQETLALAALGKFERDRQGLAALLQRMASILREAMLRPPKEGPLAALVERAGRLRLLAILDIIEDTAYAVTQNTGGLLLVTSFCARVRSAMAPQ